MYSPAGVCVIQTYTALKDQRLYTCTGNNNITKSVFYDAVHRLYQTLLYIKNVIQFHETHTNVISLTPIRKVDLPRQFSQNLPVFNSMLCTSLIPKLIKIGQLLRKEQTDIHLCPYMKHGSDCAHFHEKSQ